MLLKKSPHSNYDPEWPKIKFKKLEGVHAKLRKCLECMEVRMTVKLNDSEKIKGNKKTDIR